MKLIKLEVFTDSDREKIKTIVLNPTMIAFAALHEFELKPVVVLSDYEKTAFFLTMNGIATIKALKSLIIFPMWENNEKLRKVQIAVNPTQLAFMDVNNGYEYMFLGDGSLLTLSDEATTQLMKYV